MVRSNVRQQTKPEKRCVKCGTVTKSADFEEFCDWCANKIERNDKTGYPFEWNFVPRGDKYDRDDPKFCSIEHAFKWLVQHGVDWVISDQGFFNCYLHEKEVDFLVKVLTGKVKVLT